MNQENQETNSATPENLPVKRKRGRPRKDKSLIQGEKVSVTPTPDAVKRNPRRKTEPAAEENDPMVGKVVSGVLDGSFDAGYLLTVRVDDTDTILRGVVFEPTLSIPISGANDVAPHVKMFKRTDIPIPVVDPITQVRGSTSQSEQKSERAVKVLQSGEASLLPEASSPVNQVPKVAHQVLPSQLQITPVALKGVQNDTKQVVKVPQAPPLALQQAEDKTKIAGNLLALSQSGDVNQVVKVSSQGEDSQIEKNQPTAVLPKDKVGLPPGGIGNTDQGPIITPLDTAQPELKEPASATQPVPVEQNETAKLDMLQETEHLSQSGTPDDEDASKDLMLEHKTEPSVEISPRDETIDQVPPAEHQAVGSDPKPKQHIDVAMKDQAVELNHTTAAAAPQFMATQSITEATSSTVPTEDVDLIFKDADPAVQSQNNQ